MTVLLALSYNCKYMHYPNLQINTIMQGIENTEYWIQDTVYWILATGNRIQDTGYRILDTGYRIQDTGYRILSTGYCIPEVSGMFYSRQGRSNWRKYPTRPTLSFRQGRSKERKDPTRPKSFMTH